MRVLLIFLLILTFVISCQNSRVRQPVTESNELPVKPVTESNELPLEIPIAKLFEFEYKLQSGDIILRTPLSLGSLAICILSMSGYSHAGIIFKEQEKTFVYHCYNKEHCIEKISLEEFCTEDVLHILVIRMPAMNIELLESVLLKSLEQSSDKFCLINNNCAEFVCAVFQKIGIKLDLPNNIEIYSKVLAEIKARYDDKGMELISNKINSIYPYYRKQIEKSIELKIPILAPGHFEFQNGFQRIIYAKKQDSKFNKAYDCLFSRYEDYRKRINQSLSKYSLSKILDNFANNYKTYDDIIGPMLAEFSLEYRRAGGQIE